MAKYSGPRAVTRVPTIPTIPTAPIRATDERTRTYNGDEAYVRDAKSELFVLAVNFMGEQEPTFYESGDDRQARFVNLIHQVTNEDPKWMQSFIPFLRDEAFMRTAPVVALVEYARAGGPEADKLIARTLRRADEPAELLGYYWATNEGRKTIAQSIKRGVALSANKLYTEFNALKYDGTSKSIRFGDVLEVTHPKATSAEQSTLFAYLLDRRHHADNILTNVESLSMISKNRDFRRMPQEDRRDALRHAGSQALSDAGFTWEALSEWLPGGMDAEAWEWMIPSMGYMALLRNLRNFDEAGISDSVAETVIARLTDPEQVAKSMQFPYRFYSAYKNTHSTRWAHALDQALDLSTSNIPKLTGKSLVLIDVSGSMDAPISGKSQMRMCEAAGLFGVAQFRAAGFEGNIVVFGNSSRDISMRKGTSVLKGTESCMQNHGVGHGTELWGAIRSHYRDGYHDRVFCFTDMQANQVYGNKPVVRAPIYFWNLAGYRPAAAKVGANGVYEMAGLSDVTFRQIALLEASKNASWPWEVV